MAPGETCPTGLPMRTGVHRRERSISISVPNVLRDGSGAMMVLGMSVGTSDDKSGVGSVIGMSGPCASEMASQSLCSRRQLHPRNQVFDSCVGDL